MPKTIVIVLAVACALLGAGTTFTRSTIPRTFAGRVERVDFYIQDRAGVDDVYFINVGSDRMMVDRDVAQLLKSGDRVSKSRFSSTLTVNGKPEQLHLSRDFFHMLAAYPLIILLVALALWGDRISARLPVPRRLRASGE